MGGEKRWPLVEGPPISVGRLVLMLTTDKILIIETKVFQNKEPFFFASFS